MATTAKALRVPERLQREIEQEMAQRGSTWSAAVVELLEEAIRMRRVPGIAFMSGATGRRAIVAGTGLDVWEVISSWKQTEHSFEALREGYPWLSEVQLRAALSYFQLYPEEIEARLAREESWTPERVWREMPFTRPSM